MNEDSTGTTLSCTGFGALDDGTPVERWELDDGAVRVAVLSYGGVVQQLLAPDREGNLADVVLGFDELTGYLGPQPYFGALIGRYAGRIAAGRFPLNGRVYQLATNNAGQHLHGGLAGFDKRVWRAEPVEGAGVRLSLTSPDGDQGYPARLDVTVEYLLAGGRLRIGYTATNAEPAGGPATILNLTNHTYFNLAGHAAGSVGGHVVELPADRYALTDEHLIPTGDLAGVDGTPFDLRRGRALAAGWDDDHAQIAHAGGYDQSWVLGTVSGRLDPAARVTEPTGGRVLEVETDQPTLHLYSGNMMADVPAGKGGHLYGRRDAFCVETQHLPDSPNHPQFPSTVLAAGETFRSTTTFRFTTTASTPDR